MIFEDLKDNLKIAGILCLIILAITIPVTIVFAFVYNTLTMTGTVVSTDLASYDLAGNPITNIDWGIVEEGDNLEQTILINEGNVPLTISMDWTPQATYTWLTLTWNVIDGTTLAPNESVTITWTLNVAVGHADEDFTITVTITGTQT